MSRIFLAAAAALVALPVFAQQHEKGAWHYFGPDDGGSKFVEANGLKGIGVCAAKGWQNKELDLSTDGIPITVKSWEEAVQRLRQGRCDIIALSASDAEQHADDVLGALTGMRELTIK